MNIGDIILKQQNSPFLYAKEQGNKRKKLNYVSIPKSILNDENFPKQWRNSWKDVVID